MARQQSGSVPPYYACLGVPPDVSATGLMKRYRQLSLQLHPDRAAYRDDPDGEAEVRRRYQHITEAYEVLSDPVRRAAYDTRHSVNFGGRATAVRRAIERHNDQTTARGRTEKVDAVSGSTVKRTRHEDVSEDEDYDPHHDTAVASSTSDNALPDTPPLRRVFSLLPRRPSPAQQHWRTVTLTRPTPQAPWGLCLQRNVLLRGGGAAPVPARVTRVNHCGVPAGADVAAMIARDAGDATSLTLWLTHGVTEYVLVGQRDWLRDAALLERLVPRVPGAPAMLAEGLLPDTSVVTVNGVCVTDAAELHEELRRCADASDGDIVLGCASLHNLPPEADA